MLRELRKYRYWPWLRDGVLFALIIVGVRAYQQRNLPSGVAPSVAGVALSGHAVSLAEHRGRPVLLHFWATWCGVCRAEQSSIDAIAEDSPVITIATHSGSASNVRAYAREHRLSLTIVPDELGALAKRYGVTSFPTTFIVDGDGTIRHAEVGYTTELGLRMRMALARWH